MRIKNIFIKIALLVLANSSVAKFSEIEPVKPLAKHKDESKLIVKLIEKLHYNKGSDLNDEISKQILAKYIDILDPNKMYFMGSDIVEFDKLQYELDDAIKAGKIKPGFDIYNLFRQRVIKRADFALALLEGEFEFQQELNYLWNREKAAWPIDEKELDLIWTNRVKNDYLSLKLLDKEPEKIKETLAKRYKYLVKRTKDAKSDDVFQFFINSYVSLIEPHTGYMAPRTSENFEINMKLSLEGIGAILGNDGDYTIIDTIVKGGPADQEGHLKSGDKIASVGQGREGSYEDVVGWSVVDVVQLIRGEKGSTVRLQVFSKDDELGAEPHVISIVRDKVKLEQQAAQYQIIEVKDKLGKHKIGVISLPTFYLDFAALKAGEADYRSTTRDVIKILQTFKEKQVEGIIIDLRSNGGGSLPEAIQLTGLFINQGPIVQTKYYYGNVDVKNDVDPSIAWQGPMVVMVNKLSASASEIFAAALQDYGRAIIVGGQTFGKGTVQSLMPLQDYASNSEYKLGQLKMTMAQFFRINGGSTQKRGVIPDIKLPQSPGFDQFGESEYENALPWSSIKPSSYTMFDDLSDEIPYLTKRYKQRAEVNFEFEFIKKEIELYLQEKDDTTVSLSYEIRKKTTEDRKKRKEARKEQRKLMQEKSDHELLSEVLVLFDSKDELKSDDTLLAELKEKDDDDEEKEEYVDFKLDETARILNDLIYLKNKIVVASTDANKK